MSTARMDTAISTADAIAELLLEERKEATEEAGIGLAKAYSLVRTFAAALRIQQPPKRGRPPGKTTQRRLLGTIPAGGAE